MSAIDFIIGKKKEPPTIRWRVGPTREQYGAPPTGRVRIWPPNWKVQALNMSQIITTSQQVAVSVAFLDASNNPAPVENVLWGSSDESILHVVQDTLDTSKATVYAAGAVGTAQANVTADARMGEGEKQIVGTLAVEVVGGEAVLVVISTGEVTEQTGPTPTPTAQPMTTKSVPKKR